jgi:hypothetical protein
MARPRKKQDEAATTAAKTQTAKRRYISQSDVPRHSLDDALRIPQAIADNYGKQPTTPLDVATALQIQPTTGTFRSLGGAALAYGITDGGPNAETIGLTDLGLRIVAPTEEGDDLVAKREALMRPRVVREFLEKYDGSKLPSEQIGKNVLEQMGVPPEATERTFNLVVTSAASLGLLNDIGGQKYVNLQAAPLDPAAVQEPESVQEEVDEEGAILYGDDEGVAPIKLGDLGVVSPKEALVKNQRVFISHGKNKKIVDQLKELLAYGDFEPVVSVEKEATAKPVPEKVLSDMRSCGAGIIHVGAERVIADADGKEHHLLNYNVLIEIGAAMALFGSNFILLVEEGTQLPSNLQGLYEVRYTGTELDAHVTLKLLRAFKDFKDFKG